MNMYPKHFVFGLCTFLVHNEQFVFLSPLIEGRFLKGHGVRASVLFFTLFKIKAILHVTKILCGFVDAKRQKSL